MTSALPAGAVIGMSTFVSYLLAYPRPRPATDGQQTQASTAALITLLIGAMWVLAVVARPYQWWRVGTGGGLRAGLLVIFAMPLAREKFMLDPSNLGGHHAGGGDRPARRRR